MVMSGGLLNNGEQVNRISDFIKIVLKFVKHHGWPELLRRIWLGTTKWLYVSRNILIMKLDLQTAIEPDPSLEIKELTPSDIDRMLEIMYLSRTAIRERFGRGERCFAATNGEDIISYFWAMFGARRLDELFLEIKLRPNQAWFYNAITVKSARGKGCYPNIIRYMARALKADGFDECFIDAEERNQPSTRGMEKAGCKRLVKIRINKLLSNIKYDVTVFDKALWMQFSEAFKKPYRIKNIEDDKQCL